MINLDPQTFYGVCFILLQFIRIPFNYRVYNYLHPANKARMRMHRPHSIFDSDKKRDEKLETDFYFFYFLVIYFWVKLPKQPIGKFYAFLVLGFTIAQGILLYILIKNH